MFISSGVSSLTSAYVCMHLSTSTSWQNNFFLIFSRFLVFLNILQGHLTSVPKHSLAVVPIQIVCQNKLIHGEENCDSFQDFKSLWRHAVHVVDSAKAHSPGMTRYQQNLVLMIQEVLRSHSHLLTDDEKTFLGTKICTYYCFMLKVPFIGDM